MGRAGITFLNILSAFLPTSSFTDITAFTSVCLHPVGCLFHFPSQLSCLLFTLSLLRNETKLLSFSPEMFAHFSEAVLKNTFSIPRAYQGIFFFFLP